MVTFSGSSHGRDNCDATRRTAVIPPIGRRIRRIRRLQLLSPLFSFITNQKVVFCSSYLCSYLLAWKSLLFIQLFVETKDKNEHVKCQYLWPMVLYIIRVRALPRWRGRQMSHVASQDRKSQDESRTTFNEPSAFSNASKTF
jgi:hypothetical protein